MLRKPPTDNLFESYLRQYCKEQGITIEMLAAKAGIARGTFYNLLKPQSDPKISHFVTLANIMKIHPQTLLKLKWHEFDLTYLNAGKADFGDAAEPMEDISGFIDETIPDGTIIATSSRFVKTWTIQNLGNQAWENRSLICIDNMLNDFPYEKNKYNHRLTPRQDTVRLPTIEPMAQVTIPVFFTAPDVPGRYISYWKMVDEHGEFCFPETTGLYVSVLVKGVAMRDVDTPSDTDTNPSLNQDISAKQP